MNQKSKKKKTEEHRCQYQLYDNDLHKLVSCGIKATWITKTKIPLCEIHKDCAAMGKIEIVRITPDE